MTVLGKTASVTGMVCINTPMWHEFRMNGKTMLNILKQDGMAPQVDGKNSPKLDGKDVRYKQNGTKESWQGK